MLLFCRSLTLRRGERELLRGLDLEVRAQERWAVVGPNGVGKSTLLTVLGSGRIGPLDEGEIRRAPGTWTAMVTQAESDVGLGSDATLLDLAASALRPLEALGAELGRLAAALGASPGPETLDHYGRLLDLFEARGGYRSRAILDEALSRTGLAGAAERPAVQASEGERRRARLAGALASGAELLVLDEPTNHLDIAAREWLALRLRAHPGGLLFASHDRALIDAVATHVLWLEDGSARRIAGGYAKAEHERLGRERAQDKAERARRKRVAELEHMAEELRSHGHRGAQVRRLRAERELRGLRDPLAGPAPRAPGMALDISVGGTAADRPRRGDALARFEHLSHGDLLDDVHLSIASGERLAVVGANGSGKSTLLSLIEGLVPSDDPRAQRWWRPGASLLRLGQRDRGLDDQITPRQALLAWVDARQAETRLAAVGLPSSTWDRPAGRLSGGERARAGLALLMGREAELLLLDEPTNDLDLPAIEALEAALRETPAAFVLVSHDARLVEAVGAEVLSIEDGKLVRWRGGLQGWRRGRRRLEEDIRLPPDDPPALGGSQNEQAASTQPQGEDDSHWVQEVDAAEAALADPRRWSERDLLRWRRRRQAAEEAIIGSWEQSSGAPPPRPPFRTREEGMVVWAERADEGLRVWLDGADHEPLARAELRVLGAAPADGGQADGDLKQVGHLVLPRAADRELTPWAFRALARGAARLAFYLTSVDLVQLSDSREPGGFEALAPGWWLWRRRDLERAERWRRRRSGGARPGAGPQRRRRRRRRRDPEAQG